MFTACDDARNEPIAQSSPREETTAPSEAGGPAESDERPVPLPEPTLTFGDAVIRSGDSSALVKSMSSPVEVGVRYRFEVGHCGLTWYTDFDGSFWDVIDKHPKGRDPVSMINGDRGVMTLVSENSARYEGSDDKTVMLERAGRTQRVFYCD